MWTAVGFSPQRRCEVSLMFLWEDAVVMGGYSRSAGGVLTASLETSDLDTGGEVEALSDPLYFTRFSHGSLSRADFRHGWTAPDRLAFFECYCAWHSQEDSHLSTLIY